MSLQIVAAGIAQDSLRSNPRDNFIAEHFDRAYQMFNLFIDDPRACLDRSDEVFRALEIEGELDDQAFYGMLAQRIRELPQAQEAIPGQSVDAVLCWLLKDAAGLSYAEIGAAMKLERGQVAQYIADVREALVG